MKNYICINGKKVELTEEQVNEIKSSYGLQGVKDGETFKCNGGHACSCENGYSLVPRLDSAVCGGSVRAR